MASNPAWSWPSRESHASYLTPPGHARIASHQAEVERSDMFPNSALDVRRWALDVCPFLIHEHRQDLDPRRPPGIRQMGSQPPFFRRRQMAGRLRLGPKCLSANRRLEGPPGALSRLSRDLP